MSDAKMISHRLRGFSRMIENIIATNARIFILKNIVNNSCIRGNIFLQKNSKDII